VTNFGTIYRGPAIDGAFSLWAFGSTSPFDIALGIDDVFFADPNHFPIAAFKFQSLSLNGNPIIDTSNGGVTKLALIGVDGITSGPPGGTLTFTGLDLLALATVNGSINLTSDVSFQDLSVLAMYARGAGSNLTLDSPISNIGTLDLAAEGSIQLTNSGTMSVGEFDATAGDDLTLQIGGSLLLNGSVRFNTLVLPGTTVASGANLTLNVTGDYTNSSATEFSRLRVTNEGAHIGTGGNIAVSIGGDLTATGLGGGTGEFQAGDFALVVQNTNGQIDNGGNLTLTVNGNVQVNGLAAYMQNYDGTANPAGHIGTGGNIDIEIGGNLTANSYVDVFINNRNGGTIDSGGNITFDIGGALTTTQGDATFGISNRNDGTGGGTIGSLATVDINAASVSVGGFFQTFISTNGGGSIQGDAINTVMTSGDLTAQQGILLDIADTAFGGTGVFTGGHIGGNAIVTLNAQNITTPSTNSGIPGTDLMAIEASIYPNASGTVGGDAIVDVSASQTISAPGSVLFWVANGNYLDLGGGTIGGDATVNVGAASLSTGDLFVQILNYGGASIGGDAAINITADTLSVGGNLDSKIDNSSSGTIGGNATIDMNVSGSATVTSDATFQILGSDGAAAAAININGGSYDAGGTFLAEVDGSGTIAFTNATVHADVLKVGALGTNGVLNIGGGTLSADTTLKLYASGSNGQLNFIDNVTIGGTNFTIIAADTVTINDSKTVTVTGAKADVYTGFIGEVPKANYTGSGGNGSTTGKFAGAGANNPQPLSSAPPFDDPPLSAATVTSGGKVTSGKRTGTAINVSDSGQLLSLLDGAVPGSGGKITIPGSKSTSNWRDSSGINAAGRLNAGRRAADIRDARSLPGRRFLP